MPIGANDLGLGVTFTMHNNASQPAQAIGRSMTWLERTVQRTSVAINAAVSSITSGLIGLTIVAGALLGPFISMTGAAASFDKQMSEVAAKAQISKLSEEYAELRQQSLDLGEATKFTATEVAAGQTFLAQTGFETNKILAAMPGMLSLAAAGNMDLARTSDIASNILQGMGLEAKEMIRVADVLAATSVKANVNVEQLGESFKFAAPFAQQLGISLEQTSALVGMLGDMGVQGTLAGTAIKNFAAQTSQLTPDKLAKFNLQMSDIMDNAGNMKSIDVVFGNVIKQISQLGSLQRVQALSELFGLRGNVALAAQMSKTAKDLTAFTVTLEESAGAADRIAETMLDNLSGDIIKFKSVIQTTMITAGTDLMEFMRPVVQQLTEIVKGIQGFIKTPFGAWVIKVTAAVSTLTVALVALGFIVGVLIPAVSSLIGALINPVFLAIAGVILAIVGPVLLLINAVTKFKAVLNGAEAETGFVGFLQKVGGVVMGLVEVFRTWDGTTFNISGSMHQSLQRIGILDFFLDIATWAVRVIEFFKGMRTGVAQMWSVMQPVVTMVKTAVLGLIDTLSLFFPEMRAASGTTNEWAQAGEVLAYVLGATLVPVVTTLTKMFVGFVTWAQFGLATLKSIWETAVAFFGFFGGVAMDTISLPFKIMHDVMNGVDIQTAVFTRTSEAMESVWNRIKILWDSFKGIIHNNFEVPLQTVKNLIEQIVDIMQPIFDFFSNIKDQGAALLGQGSGMFQSLFDALVNHPLELNTDRSPGKEVGSVIAENQATRAAMQAPQKPLVLRESVNQDTRPIILQTILDGEVISEKVFEKEEIEAARN